jgi:hypothetical protein
VKGKGSLSKLEALKDEYREELKAKAPKVKKIDARCFKLRCKTAVNPARLRHSGGRLRLARGTCTRKTCPREMLEEYKRMLNLTRPWRQGEYPETAKMWWGVIKAQKVKLQRSLGW